MSSILLSNPFVTPQTTALPSAPDPQAALAVAPSSSTASNADAGNTGAGGGSGFGNRSDQQTIVRLASLSLNSGHAPDATSGSVINAQVHDPGSNPFGINLPKVEMPDPLPTSPFLAATKVRNPAELFSRFG